MLVEMRRRNMVPDLILFADTGGERPETYETVRKVSEWCYANGFPKIQIVKASISLESDCLTRKALPSIAYGFKTCSDRWKARPQKTAISKIIGASTPYTCAIGYDAGESRRARKSQDEKVTNWFPLIECGIYREDCLRICKEAGLPAHKSSCFFCPSMKRREIIQLAKDHPDLAARAIAMEENAELTSVKGLGRSFSWKEFLANEAGQTRLFSDHEVPEIPCGCYDGGAE